MKEHIQSMKVKLDELDSLPLPPFELIAQILCELGVIINFVADKIPGGTTRTLLLIISNLLKSFCSSGVSTNESEGK